MTLDEALISIFPEVTVTKTNLVLTGKEKSKVRKLTGKLFIKKKIEVYKAGNLGYAMVVRDKSQTMYFNFLVAVDKDISVNR